MTDEEVTRIPVTKKTRQDLKKLGKKGENYDNILQRILDKEMKSDD